MSKATRNVRRYERVPIGTLFVCLVAWEQMLYNIEYYQKNSIGVGTDAAWDIWTQAGDIAMDIQDILQECAMRGKLRFWDSVNDVYYVQSRHRHRV